MVRLRWFGRALLTLGLLTSGALLSGAVNTALPAHAEVTSLMPVAAPSSPLMKGIALSQVHEYWGRNARGIASDMQDVKAAGAGWIRMDLEPGAEARATLDLAVNRARARGIRVLVVLRKPPPAKDLGTMRDRIAFRAFVRSTVNRYKGWVKHWEILDEPDLPRQWNIDHSVGSDQHAYQASVNRYVTLLHEAYRTIKATDRSATVLFGGLSEWRVERYLDALVKTPAYRFFDVMSLHPYGRTPAKVLDRFHAVRSRMRSTPAYAAKPIWVTEMGYNTSWTGKVGYVPTEALKAAYLPITMRRLRAAGARGPIFWYTLHQKSATSTGYALTLKDKATLTTRRLPAFYAFRAFR
jgi:hypothetical protein